MANYKVMKVLNLMTGQALGYLGTHDNCTCIVARKEDAAQVQWDAEGDDVYLDKQTSPTDRYLGVSDLGYGSWGLKGANYREPVIYNRDKSISLKSATSRKLYGPYHRPGIINDTDWICWTGKDDNNQNILGFEMEG